MNPHLAGSFFQQPIIERRHLLEKLALASQHKLTLIIAPPGYGKTTLVTQFMREATLPVIWHSLEPQEQDVPDLVQHCLSALSALVPTIMNLSPAAATSAGELATLITDTLKREIKTEFIYVMDDIHHLLESPGAKTWLRAFVAHLPATCHLILVGRAFPALSVMDMIARREVLSIGQEQLGFSIEEVEALAEKVESGLSSPQIEKIYGRLRGWPAGMILAVQPLPLDIEQTLFNGNLGPEALFNELAEGLFRIQPPALQTFLLGSSTVSRFTPAFCQNVLHLKNSSEQLAEALQRKLFITEIKGGIAYHPLFRDFLQQYLRAHNPAQFSQYHAEAGDWFEAENQLDTALEHYITAGKWDEAANLAERSAHIYLSHGKTEALLHWRTQLRAVEMTVPRLLHMSAMIYRDRYEYELALLDADAAELGFQDKGNVTGLIQIALLRATIDNQQGYFQSAIERATPFMIDSSTPANLKGYALAIIGTAALHLRKLDDALSFLQTALPLWRDTGDLFAVAQLLMTLEVVYLRLGRFSDAAKCVQEVMAIRRQFGETVGIAMALNNLGYHYHLLGDYQQARQTLQEGLQVAKRVPESRTESHILWTLGDLERDQGSFDEAALLYQRSLQRVGDHEPFLQASVLLSWATLKRWQGDLDQAQMLALEADAIAEQQQLLWEHVLATLALTAIDVERGVLEWVKPELESIVQEWRQHPAPQLVQAIGLCAYMAVLSADGAAAHRYLKLAINNANHPANLQPLIAEIVHTPRLKVFVEQNASRYEGLQRGVKALEAAQIAVSPLPEIVEPTTHVTTYGLKVSVLGQERVERDGQKVLFSHWQAASARELFYYLLFKRPSTLDELGLVLWPDSSAQQIRQKFHTTLHRIRNALGANVILFENDLYTINPQIDLWCDVHQFKAVIKQAQPGSFLLEHTEFLWRRAIELFQGDFLSAFDMDWVIAYRESLTQMYLDALVALANCVRLRGDLKEAIKLLNRALEVDPFREDIHRLLLGDYNTLGDRSRIVRHMDTVTQIFQDELGTNPSPETVSLSKTFLG